MANTTRRTKKAHNTIDAYTYHVGRCAQFLGKPLEDATPSAGSLQKTDDTVLSAR